MTRGVNPQLVFRTLYRLSDTAWAPSLTRQPQSALRGLCPRGAGCQGQVGLCPHFLDEETKSHEEKWYAQALVSVV